MLYPLKFFPILKERIWGGDTLIKAGKRPAVADNDIKIGESWEISGVGDDVSTVSNGFLKSNDLQELIEVYMGDLLGDSVYEKYGMEFPLLIKFIDAREALSVQVHPDDELAGKRHGTRGKTEMWYVAEADPGASLYVGFNKAVSRDEYLDAVAGGSLASMLQEYKVAKGDCYYIPAGTVHAIGKGLVVAEIQETSDITYRIYDWDRVDDSGTPRKLHTQEAVDAIDFAPPGGGYKRTAKPAPDSAAELASSPFFTTNLINLRNEIDRDYAPLDSFVIYICTDGSCTVWAEGAHEDLKAYECILIPADIDDVKITGSATILEVFL